MLPLDSTALNMLEYFLLDINEIKRNESKRGGLINPLVAYSCNFFLKIMVVVTYSEMVILPNNHIFNLKNEANT